MGGLDAFLGHLFDQGRAVVRDEDPDGPGRGPSSAALDRLSRAYEVYSLDLPGPPVPFDAAVAGEAAELLRRACRALVIRDERVRVLETRLAMHRAPRTPSDHASADLVLRYLPQVHRRARAIDTADPLVDLLANTLRGWPLSGVLAGLDEPPLAPPEFGGHAGLMLLYAERFAAHGRPAWEPGGEAGEYLALLPAAAPRRAAEGV